MAAIFMAASATLAGEETIDKRQFHLFNPTPREHLRDLAADSPITLDAGRFRVEASFFDYGRSRGGDVITYGGLNLTAGLLHNVDLQLGFNPSVEVRTWDSRSNITETMQGFSDLHLRVKINVWGNDGGRTALAFFPFIKISTGSDLSNDEVEGGVVLPFALQVDDRLTLEVIPELNFIHDGDSRGYEIEFVHSALVGVSLTESLDASFGYTGVAGSSDSEYSAWISAGLTYATSSNVLLDVGARAGLSRAAERGGVFAGITIRF